MVDRTLVKPDSVEKPTEEETAGQVPRIYADYHDEHIPLTQYVREMSDFIDQIIEQPEAFNLASKPRADEIAGKVSDTEDDLEELERIIDILLAISDIKNAKGECSKCSGQLEVKHPLFQDSHVVCTACDNVEALLE